MRKVDDTLRDHLVRALDWEDAHVGFDAAVEGIAPALQGSRPAGFEHSPWELLEHLRIAQEDILDFCLNPLYEHSRKWPDDYWPAHPAPRSAGAWDRSVEAFRHSREGIKKLVHGVDDLSAKVPAGKSAQTYLRAVLLAIDHAAYHVGQLVAARRALGAWK
jgi:hypothetical protein